MAKAKKQPIARSALNQWPAEGLGIEATIQRIVGANRWDELLEVCRDCAEIPLRWQVPKPPKGYPAPDKGLVTYGYSDYSDDEKRRLAHRKKIYDSCVNPLIELWGSDELVAIEDSPWRRIPKVISSADANIRVLWPPWSRLPDPHIRFDVVGLNDITFKNLRFWPKTQIPSWLARTTIDKKPQLKPNSEPDGEQGPRLHKLIRRLAKERFPDGYDDDIPNKELIVAIRQYAKDKKIPFTATSPTILRALGRRRK